MTDGQNNSLNMANVTVALLNKNATIFTTNAKMNALLAAIVSTIGSINQTAGTQATDTTGATTTKQNLHQIAIDKAEHVTAGLEAYAADINDTTLAAQVHFTHSDFSRGTLNEIVTRMNFVYNTAHALPAATMTLYNVSATDISDLNTAITNYNNAAPTKKVMQATTTAATDALPPLFTTLSSQLVKMDKWVKTYKTAQPAFFAAYTNARKIVDLGKTTQAEELVLMPHHFEAIFGKKFLEGDTFTVRNHSPKEIILALTDTPNVMATTNLLNVPPMTELQAEVSKNFGGVFGHWLLVHNPDDIDDAKVTIILAHGKSHSSAAPVGNVSA